MLLKLSHPKNKKKSQGTTYLIKKLLMTIWGNFPAFFLNFLNSSWGWFLQEWLSVRCSVCDTITITESSYFLLEVTKQFWEVNVVLYLKIFITETTKTKVFVLIMV